MYDLYNRRTHLCVHFFLNGLLLNYLINRTSLSREILKDIAKDDFMKKLILNAATSIFMLFLVSINPSIASELNYFGLKESFESSQQGINTKLYDYFPGRCVYMADPYSPVASVLVTWTQKKSGPLFIWAHVLVEDNSVGYFDARYSRQYAQDLINNFKHRAVTPITKGEDNELQFRDDMSSSYQLRRKDKFLFVKVLGPKSGFCYFWSLSKFPI
jgi:hypothetical protein